MSIIVISMNYRSIGRDNFFGDIMSNKIKKWVKKWFNLYSVEDLRVGGHCGCCGEWIEKEIVPKIWPYSICEKCLNDSETIKK